MVCLHLLQIAWQPRFERFHLKDDWLFRRSCASLSVFFFFFLFFLSVINLVGTSFLKDHTQPKCIAGEHRTSAIFCNTENTYSPIVFDHRTVSLQYAETGCCRCLLYVLLEFIVCTLRIFGSYPSLFTNMKCSNRGRPPRKEIRHVVWLTTSTLKVWNERERNVGFTEVSCRFSNSEFAEALLYGILPGEGSRSESISVKWGWLAYTTSAARDICIHLPFSVRSLDLKFFVASLVFMKGPSCCQCVIRRNLQWYWAVTSCLWQTSTGHRSTSDFRCNLHVAAWSLTPL